MPEARSRPTMKARGTRSSRATRGAESHSNRTATSSKQSPQSESRTEKVRVEESLALFFRGPWDEIFWGTGRGLSKIVTRITTPHPPLRGTFSPLRGAKDLVV